MADNLSTAMPYDLEAEQSVLGSILVDTASFGEVVSLLTPDSFFAPQHKVIYSAMVTMNSSSNGVIDPVVLADTLAKSGHYDVAGGRQYLIQLRDSVPSTANIVKYAKIVREKHYLRNLIQISRETIEAATSGTVEANALLDKVEQSVYDIRKGNEVNGPQKIDDIIVKDVYQKFQNLTGENKDDYKGIPTGFGLLDKYTTGFNKGNLILIGARPAMGKTSFALNLATNITMIAKKKCVFFSLEMSKEELAERILASQAGVSSTKFKTGEMTQDEWIRVGNAAGSFTDVELYLDDTSSITVPEIKSRIRRLKGVDAIIIDYLGLLQSAVRKENRVQEVAEITRNLKMMAKDLKIPVICCAQLSRGTEGRGKSHKPQLSDLRDSGSIEQDADVVMFLYREKYYENEQSEEKREEIDDTKTELIVAKNRHGQTGSILLAFDQEFTRFRSVENAQNYN